MGRRRLVVWGAVFSCIVALAFVLWVTALPRLTDAGEYTPIARWWLAPVEVGTGIVWLVTGAVLATLRPRNVLGWMILGVGVSISWSVALEAYGTYGHNS